MHSLMWVVCLVPLCCSFCLSHSTMKDHFNSTLPLHFICPKKDLPTLFEGITYSSISYKEFTQFSEYLVSSCIGKAQPSSTKPEKKCSNNWMWCFSSKRFTSCKAAWSWFWPSLNLEDWCFSMSKMWHRQDFFVSSTASS